MTKQANEMAAALSYVLPYWPDSMEQIGDLEEWRGGRDVASKRALMAYLGQCGVTGMTAHVGARPAQGWDARDRDHVAARHAKRVALYLGK